ncbi:MobA/MobL family protein, partial [Komagataeibacter rhaeticus]|nr:MobA/MobL family protein [Komagataeibacter rhaeticus]
TRSVDENGFGAKERSWNDKEILLTWRERWASLANERLAELDLDVRIDHRSFAAQGLILSHRTRLVRPGCVGKSGARMRNGLPTIWRLRDVMARGFWRNRMWRWRR